MAYFFTKYGTVEDYIFRSEYSPTITREQYLELEKKDNMEKRYIENKVEIRAEDDKTFIEGSGIVFGVESQDLGGFTEIIDPRALDGADMSDVIIRTEHDNNFILGRTSSGTAEVSINGDTADYRVEVPNTNAGRDVIELIKRGDINGSSFAFSGVTDDWEERDNGTVLRTITEIRKIHDMSPVVNPAYLQTNNKVALRSLDEWKKQEGTKEIKEKPTKVGLSLANKIKLERLK